VETALAGAAGDDAELCAEAADLLYHLGVLLHARGLAFDDVMAVLASRARTP
jgi:phosphoribosyl-ATP pyrophosphohydrolase/phosphoribosyl-AMP cyclohydrolase